jgi:phenylacetate-CoA ligase
MSRPYHIAPKVRYNIHDRGHVLRFPELKRILRETGRADLLTEDALETDLPLLFLYGRSDMSIDYYGANVTPESIREVIYTVEALAPIVSTYRLLSFEDDEANKRMEIAVELEDGAAMPEDVAVLEEVLLERLAAINGDFLNAWKHTAPATNMPKLSLHQFGTGPFAGGQRKLKNEYVATDIKYDKLT